MDITVTFDVGPAGQRALVRMRNPGEKPTFRSLVLGGSPEESAAEIEAFILAHLYGPGRWQGWLWEA